MLGSNGDTSNRLPQTVSATSSGMPLGQPGLDGISPHGLRKAFAAQQAEEGSSTSQIAALGGWDNLKQVETYTKSARRQKLAEDVVSRRQKRAEEE